LAQTEPINSQIIVYLNRLSDLLFVLARVHNDQGRDDVLWVPGKTRSESGGAHRQSTTD
jgi:cob(I)alamin adenosyltransferase